MSFIVSIACALWLSLCVHASGAGALESGLVAVVVAALAIQASMAERLCDLQSGLIELYESKFKQLAEMVERRGRDDD